MTSTWRKSQKFIPTWAKEPLVLRLHTSATLLFFHGLLTEKELFRVRSRILKASQRGDFLKKKES